MKLIPAEEGWWLIEVHISVLEVLEQIRSCGHAWSHFDVEFVSEKHFCQVYVGHAGLNEVFVVAHVMVGVCEQIHS